MQMLSNSVIVAPTETSRFGPRPKHQTSHSAPGAYVIGLSVRDEHLIRFYRRRRHGDLKEQSRTDGKQRAKRIDEITASRAICAHD